MRKVAKQHGALRSARSATGCAHAELERDVFCEGSPEHGHDLEQAARVHVELGEAARDEVVEVLEDEQRAERSCSPAAQGDGEGDELLEPPPIEASEREIYDQGTRELLLQSMAERVVTLAASKMSA